MAFPGDYSLYQNVTIDAGEVDATLTDYPCYIDLSDMVKVGDDIFDTCRSDGGDIRVTLADGTTQLAREVVSIDTSGKTGELHVKIPSLASAVDTVIRILYNGTDTEPTEDSTYGKENTWNSDYLMVQHMNQDPSEGSPQMLDSTDNDNDGTSAGSMTSGDLVAAQIGNGLDFDGSDDEIVIDDNASFTSAEITLQCWVDRDNNDIQVISKDNGSSGRDFALKVNSSNKLAPLFWNQAGSVGFSTSSADVSATGMQMLHGTWDGSTIRGYINGSADGTASLSGTSVHDSTTDVSIGGANVSGDSPLNGIVDEVRILAIELSAAWISTEYNNQSSPSTFYAVSDEQTTGGSTLLPIMNHHYTKNIGVN